MDEWKCTSTVYIRPEAVPFKEDIICAIGIDMYQWCTIIIKLTL